MVEVSLTLRTVVVLMFLFQMDPTRISKEHAHCVRTLFGHQESTDLRDASFESQEVKLMPESCRNMKQALQRAVQRVSGTDNVSLFHGPVEIKTIFPKICIQS